MKKHLKALQSLYNAQKAGESIDWMSIDNFHTCNNWYSVFEMAQFYGIECPKNAQSTTWGYALTDYQIVAGDIVKFLPNDAKEAAKMAKYPHLYCKKCGEFIGSDEDEHVAHYGECH